jgi:hypothetical protein
MLRFFKFHAGLPDPAPARESYGPRSRGRGWPDQCPPLRAANAFGWDVIAAFAMTFTRSRDGSWRLARPHDVVSDWAYDGGGGAEPLVQRNAWFWEKGQKIPHVISPNVFQHLRNQVKVSTFLYLETDPGELLVIGEIPNQRRPYRAFTALIDTDRYPASYPWHCVLELDARERKVTIEKGEPFCRLAVVPRATFTARAMSDATFGRFFERGQEWVLRHAKGPPSEMMDITGAYARQQKKARFHVRRAAR